MNAAPFSQLPDAVPSVCRRPALCERRGYTLLELLIVLGVLAAIAGLTLPAIRGPLDKSRLTAAARQLQAALAKARALAVREAVPVQLRYEIDGSRYVIERTPQPPAPLLPVAGDSDAAAGTPAGLLPEPAAVEATAAMEPSAAAALSDLNEPGTAATDGFTGQLLREGELPVGVTFAEPSLAASENTVGSGTFDSSSVVTGSADNLTATNSAGTPADNTASAAVTASGLSAPPRWSAPIRFQPSGRTVDQVIQLRGQRDFVVEVRLRGLTASASYSAPVRRRPVTATVPTTEPSAAAGTAASGAQP